MSGSDRDALLSQKGDDRHAEQQTPGGNKQGGEPKSAMSLPLKKPATKPEAAVTNHQTQSDQPDPYELRDLIAQEVMADAAVWMAVAAFLTFAVTSIGTLLIWRQVKLTLQAVKETGHATKAMVRTNEIALLQYEAGFRPRLVVEVRGPPLQQAQISQERFLEPNTVFHESALVFVKVTNYSDNPALLRRWTVFNMNEFARVAEMADNAPQTVHVLAKGESVFLRRMGVGTLPEKPEVPGLPPDKFNSDRANGLPVQQLTITAENRPKMLGTNLTIRGVLEYTDTIGTRYRLGFARTSMNIWSEDLMAHPDASLTFDERIDDTAEQG